METTKRRSSPAEPKNLEGLFLFQDLLGRGLEVWKKKRKRIKTRRPGRCNQA